MTSSLPGQEVTQDAGARVELGPVVSVDHLSGGIVEITARLPRLAATAAPGQFAQLRCGDPGPLLRRPFSVAWTDGELCSFVLAAVGAGTALLAALRPGDRLDALGPLGRGFTVAGGRGLGGAGGGGLAGAPDRAICVSGGLGCAPFPLLARALRARGTREVVVLSGAATATRLYPAERFARGDGGIVVREATDDGSRGGAGRVTALLEGALDGAGALYACGPNPMLAAVADAVRPASTPRIREASMEAPMGCGFGICLGCALPLRRVQRPSGDRREPGAIPARGRTAEPGAIPARGGTADPGAGAEVPAGADPATAEDPEWALCCRDGPVMDLDRIDWEAMRSLPPPSVA